MILAAIAIIAIAALGWFLVRVNRKPDRQDHDAIIRLRR